MTENSIKRESFARYDMHSALLDGLFEPTKKTRKLDDEAAIDLMFTPSKKVEDAELHLKQISSMIDYRDPETGVVTKDAIHLRLRVPKSLGVQAETILLTAIKMAGQQQHQMDSQENQSMSISRPSDMAKKQPTMTIQTTARSLMKESGMQAGGSSYRVFHEALQQMSEIRVYYENKVTKWKGGDWLFSYQLNDDGRLIITLNWRLTGAILGRYLHAEIDLNERKSLKRDPSKTLHRWLSAYLWRGKSTKLKVDTLISHVWTDPAEPAAARKRLQRMQKEILPEIAALPGWEVTVEKGLAYIRRH